jgi:heme-degrading monooxygenase HmoA
MFSVAFIWEPGDYDAEFHSLNARIDDVACALPGFRGVESWQATAGTRRNATYYWDTLETLQAFSTHTVHQEAKRQYARWYAGYHVVVAQVLRSYGDGAFAHVTPNDRRGG